MYSMGTLEGSHPGICPARHLRFNSPKPRHLRPDPPDARVELSLELVVSGSRLGLISCAEPGGGKKDVASVDLQTGCAFRSPLK